MHDKRRQTSDTERGAGILTPGQREYLRGEKEFDSPQTERDMRYKIRQRVRNALADFELLNEHLEPRDRKQIFKNVRPAAERGDEYVNEDEVPRLDKVSDVLHAVAFLYSASEDVDVPFEKVVELGVTEAKYGRMFAPRNVDVRIQEEVVIDYDEIFEKIGRDDGLSEFESLAVANLVAEDFDRYVSLCESVDLDIERKLNRGENLSLGESYVAFGLLSEEGQTYREYDLREATHDEVVSVSNPGL